MKGVEEMMAGAELVKLASKQPEAVQLNIKVKERKKEEWILKSFFPFQELLDQGATESEVLKLLKDAMQQKKEGVKI